MVNRTSLARLLQTNWQNSGRSLSKDYPRQSRIIMDHFHGLWCLCDIWMRGILGPQVGHPAKYEDLWFYHNFFGAVVEISDLLNHGCGHVFFGVKPCQFQGTNSDCPFRSEQSGNLILSWERICKLYGSFVLLYFIWSGLFELSWPVWDRRSMYQKVRAQKTPAQQSILDQKGNRFIYWLVVWNIFCFYTYWE